MKFSTKHGNNCWRVLKSALLILPIFISCSTKGQVDQRWLESWNEANKTKPSKISSVSRIALENEPGTPLIIKGIILNPDDTPAKGVIVHAYHRDVQGYDFGEKDSAYTTWRLQGWAKTDENGTFEFRTIRPAPDHLEREGPHIHFTTVSNKFGRQWAPKIFLSDDPLLTESQRQKSKKAGNNGWISEVREINGTQFIDVNIKLKKNGDF
ncbi:MAG: hypothetical protein KJN76_04725 [Eudoraea sp.]|nr:hypothetical protein [Eudoraea sp.]